jgi:hypothetical protein
MAKAWYAYNCNNNCAADPFSALSYRLIVTEPGCLDGPDICAILANGGGTVPISPLSYNIKRYIAQGLTTHLAQPQTPTFSKLYVYLKSCGCT